MSFQQTASQRLHSIREAGLYRRAREVTGIQGPYLTVDGRRVLCLSSNNYLGLAGDPALTDAASRALSCQGLGAGASRLISGSMSAHRQAEETLARFVGREQAVLFSTGYAANVGVVQALATRHDVIFSDALVHASLIDGARLSRAQVRVFQHNDPAHLRELLREHRAEGQAALILTESIFSMDGDLAPLAELQALAGEFNAGLLVDEAHALGVVGPGGRGLCAAQGIHPDVVVGTLGKAFGAQGAFVAATGELIDLIRNRARSYIFSTAPAVPLAGLVRAAVDLVVSADERRARLLRHARRLRQGLSAMGYRVLPGATQIVPVLVGDPQPTMALSLALLEGGVFAHGIRPPTVPDGTGRLRVVPMATHTDEDISRALQVFQRLSS